MNKLGKLFGIASMLFLVFTQAEAADKKADAVALMDKAIAHFTKVGADQAYKDFSDPKSGFIQGEIYVVVQDMPGNMVHHATNPKLNGKNILGLKDADGREFNKDMVAILQKANDGWVKYKWSNPETKKIGQKESYIKKVNNDLYFIVGYYTD
ncbi:MAG: cache domain-containing protein [Rhodospirillales bacterium]|nr:cache domain-containing protein [Rhodospirillales bacterium]